MTLYIKPSLIKVAAAGLEELKALEAVQCEAVNQARQRLRPILHRNLSLKMIAVLTLLALLVMLGLSLYAIESGLRFIFGGTGDTLGIWDVFLAKRDFKTWLTTVSLTNRLPSALALVLSSFSFVAGYIFLKKTILFQKIDLISKELEMQETALRDELRSEEYVLQAAHRRLRKLKKSA